MREPALPFADLLDSHTAAIARSARSLLSATGALDAAKRAYWRVRPPRSVNLPVTSTS